MQVTVTGGAGHPPVTLDYTAHDLAFLQANAYASIIDSTYTTAIYYNPNDASSPASPGYLIIPTKYANNIIDARGFGAVVDENNKGPSTILGGSARFGQIVLAGDGGLTYEARQGDNTVVAGGGNNFISFLGDKGANAAYTSTGNDNIVGGDGSTTISAGAGNNKIFLGEGYSLVYSTGRDTVSLSSGGNDTINVLGTGSDVVRGADNGTGAKLTFIGGVVASTVRGGAGSDTISGGVGGGVFYGGSGGNNYIVAGAGSVTIVGGGNGDTLLGGYSSDLIRAGYGNETLGGGGGNNVFDLRMHLVVHGCAHDVDKITDFTTQDLLNVGGTRAINYALSTYHVVDGNGTFRLEDGSKVVLNGYAHPLTQSDFTH